MTSREPSAAEKLAADENSARARLDAGRDALGKIKSRELAEAEAHALAQIRIQTERSLAHQAEALRDAERRAEVAAIERRTADLDAAKEAQRRSALEAEALAALQARQQGDVAAAEAARQRLAALAELEATIAARRTAAGEMRETLKGKRLAWLRVVWAAFRCASPLKVALIALMLGVGLGYGWARLQRPALAVPTVGEAAPLKLEFELQPGR